jgi:hypothetical protein
MAKVLSPYTLCQVVVHLEQAFSIRLQKPVESSIAKAKEKYNFKDAKLDDDGDFVASSGETQSNSEAKIRSVSFYSSRNALSIDLLGGDTKECLRIISTLLSVLYSLNDEDLTAGISYIEYKTVTKCQLSTNLDGIFSDKFQKVLDGWRRFESEIIISKLPKNVNEDMHGMLSISNDYFNRMFEGQERMFAVPSEFTFHIFVPTKYYSMSKYKISIHIQSFEDYTDQLFMFTTELPYDDHVDLINSIESMG